MHGGVLPAGSRTLSILTDKQSLCSSRLDIEGLNTHLLLGGHGNFFGVFTYLDQLAIALMVPGRVGPRGPALVPVLTDHADHEAAVDARVVMRSHLQLELYGVGFGTRSCPAANSQRRTLVAAPSRCISAMSRQGVKQKNATPRVAPVLASHP